MGEARRIVRIISLPNVTHDVRAEWLAAEERLEDERLALVILRIERLAELVAPVPSEEAMRRMGGER